MLFIQESHFDRICCQNYCLTRLVVELKDGNVTALHLPISLTYITSLPRMLPSSVGNS